MMSKMSKTMLILSAVAISIVAMLSLAAYADFSIPANQHAKENAKAPEHSEVITDSWDLVRVDFIHYAKGQGPAKNPKSSSCYSLMGVKWTSTPVRYVVNPTNQQGLSESFITSTISASAETWDAATSKELFNDAYAINSSAHYGVQDFVNTIEFGAYSNNGVIAVTSVWYTRIGKQIVEFDQLYNTFYNWGNVDTEGTSVMDLKNIAVHELGHAVGLNDIYSTACNAVTMYGYSGYGETSKRSLEQPDITGLQAIYGN